MNCPIIITGVGKRIGLHLAKHFLQQGMPVVGTYRSHYASIDELKQLGCDVYSLDFYCQDQLDTFIEAIKAKYPQLRGIIHNASDWLPDSDTLLQQEIFNKMMLVHASVPYQLNLGFRDLLQKGEGSSRDIIHLTDYVAQTGSKKHMAYAASKAALENLTLSFASLFAPEVKVNSIAPALVKFNPDDSEEYKKKALNKALLPREGGYSSVVATVEYILNSDYVTGRSFALDGGRHLK